MSFLGAEVVEAEPVVREARDWKLARLNGEQFMRLHDAMFPILESVYERSNGTLDPRSLLQAVIDDAMQVWVVTDGHEMGAVLGTSIATLISDKRVCKVHFCAGHHSGEWLHLLDEVEAWAAYEGCVSMEIRARKGWARKLPDYRLTHVVLEKEL